MKLLTLQITRANLEQILSGVKKNEYREIRPKNSKKYIEYFIDEDKEENVRPVKYDGIQFFVGYKKDRPEAIVLLENSEIEYIVDEETGEFVEYEENGEMYLTAQMVYSVDKVKSKKNI